MTPKSMSLRHKLLGLTVAMLWGVNFLAIHAGLEHFPPIFFAALRFAVMAIPVIIFVPRPDVPLRWFLLYGFGFGTVQFAFLFLAMDNGMPTGLASLVLQASAPFTVILGVLLLGERMSWRQVAGIAVAVGGMGLIATDRALHGASAAVVPVLLTLLGALGWAFGNIGNRQAMKSTATTAGSQAPRMDPKTPLRLTLWMSVVPPIPLFALSATTEGPSAGWSSMATLFDHSGLIALAGLGYVVLLGTVVGSGLWTHLMSHHPASRVAPFSLLVPVVGISTSWLVLNETPSVWELIGAVVVIGGCLLGMTSTGKPSGRFWPGSRVEDSSPCEVPLAATTPLAPLDRTSAPDSPSALPPPLAGHHNGPVAAKDR